jgi:hypothetical protein
MGINIYSRCSLSRIYWLELTIGATRKEVRSFHNERISTINTIGLSTANCSSRATDNSITKVRTRADGDLQMLLARAHAPARTLVLSSKGQSNTVGIPKGGTRTRNKLFSLFGFCDAILLKSLVFSFRSKPSTTASIKTPSLLTLSPSAFDPRPFEIE